MIRRLVVVGVLLGVASCGGSNKLLTAAQHCKVFGDQVGYSQVQNEAGELIVTGSAPGDLDAIRCVLNELNASDNLVEDFTGDWKPGLPPRFERGFSFYYVGRPASSGEPNVEVTITPHG